MPSRRAVALLLGIRRNNVLCQCNDSGNAPHGNLVEFVLDSHERDSAEDTKCEKNLRAQGAADFLNVFHVSPVARLPAERFNGVD